MNEAQLSSQEPLKTLGSGGGYRGAEPGQHYLWDELEESVGVERANGQGYEVEQQSLVKGFLHEGHNARPDQRTQRDQRHTQDPITPH